MPDNLVLPSYDGASDCREKLKSLSLDELMITTVLLMEENPKSIPKDKESLIRVCINELFHVKKYDRIASVDSAIRDIQRYAASTDESKWIKDPMPKRLEAFLRKTLLNHNWIDIEGASNKSRFLLMYNIQTLEYAHDGVSKAGSLKTLQRGWSKLKNLNELKGIAEADTKDFLEHFSKEYKRLIKENSPTFTLRKLNSIQLDTIDDALIWLDLFSDNPLERSAITDKILKSWQQKQYRKTSGKTQKNFSLSEATISTLKKLVDNHNLNETEIITILINEELKNDIYIKEVLNRANAIQRAINGE